jgi:hypothetical protein
MNPWHVSYNQLYSNKCKRKHEAPTSKAGGNKSQAAVGLGLTRKTLYSGLKPGSVVSWTAD